jgi:putative DNA primase/helicase
VIPFEQEFRGAGDDKHLLGRLLTPRELSGVLNWALDGLDRLRANGDFSDSSATDTAKDRFRVEVDSVAAYVDECCEWDPRARVKRQVIYDLYTAWCRRNGRRPVSVQNFGGGLRRAADAVGAELDNGQTRVKKDRVWVGVGVRDVPWV